MLRRLAAFLAMFAICAVAGPLQARDWASAGGWDIAEVDADTCVMGLEYEGEGETLLALMLSLDNSVVMSVTNYRWSSERDKVYDLIYFLNGTAYEGGQSFGFHSGIRKGFASSFEPDFLKHFAASTYLKIESEDGVTIDSLNLDGSAAGLSQLRRCLAHLKAVAAAEAREKAKFAHIPADPFAVVKGESVKGKTETEVKPPSSAVGLLSGLVTASDYPASAIAIGEQGTVRFRLTIGSNGRVTGCTIIASSGSSLLDATTCRLMTSRARFTPARSSAGDSVEGTFEGAISWRL